ncbi:hypothetical protein D3C87_1541890 [compost metagenome]
MTGFDKVVNLCDDALDDKVFAFTLTNFLTENGFAFGCSFDTGFFHGLVYDAAEVDFWVSFMGEIVDGRAFAAACKADKCDDFYVFIVFH